MNKTLRKILSIGIGHIVFFIIVICIFIYTELASWHTSSYGDYGFGFSHPSNWYTSPDVISKENFESGNYLYSKDSEGVFGFHITKEGDYYNSFLFPGYVNVYFYKNLDHLNGENVQGCKYEKIDNGNYICGGKDFLYAETNSYVFNIDCFSTKEFNIFLANITNKFICRRIMKSFNFINPN